LKKIFLDTLSKLCYLPGFTKWENDFFQCLFDLPEVRGIGIRLMPQDPNESRKFVINHPYSPDTLLSLLNWADQFPILFEGESGNEKIFNGVLPQNDKILAIFTPFIFKKFNYGEMIFVLNPLSLGSFFEWGSFCEQVSAIIFDKYLSSPGNFQLPPESNIGDLEFLHEVQKMLVRENPRKTAGHKFPFSTIEWFDEDQIYLQPVLSKLQAQYDIETVFFIQRVSPETTHIAIGSWVDSLEEVRPEVHEMIDNILSHDNLGSISNSPIRVFQTVSSQPDHSNRDALFRTFACQVGGELYGHLGLCTHGNVDLNGLSRLATMLANHLAFWFAHLFQLRKEEIHGRMLQQINNTCNLMNSNVNVKGIVDQLIETLENLFGQKSGAVFLISSFSHEIETVKVFGKPPPHFNPQTAVDIPGVIRESMTEASGFQSSRGCSDQFVRLVFPLCPILRFSGQIDVGSLQRSLGAVVIFDLPENAPLPDEKRDLLTILLNGVSASLQGALNYHEKLDTIAALEGLIGKLWDKDELISQMIDIIKRLLKVNRISFLTLDANGEYLTIQKCYGLPPGVMESTKIPLGAEISGHVAKTGKSMRIDNIETDDIFQKRSMEHYFNKSLLSVPLISSADEKAEKIIGVINVNNKDSVFTFTEQDQELLEAIAHLVVVALENVALLKTRHENTIYQTQMEMAREVQTALLPKEFIGIPQSIRMFARSLPARQIGGDLYDGLPLANGWWLAAIGDVSGKGMPAAILMATTRIILRTVAGETWKPAEILNKVNEILARELERNFFVTMQLVAINPMTGTGLMASAGHGPLLTLKNGKSTFYPTVKGLPLGIRVCKGDFEEISFSLNRNDSILFFTDGLTEQRSDDGQMFGVERIEKLLENYPEKSPSQVVEGFFEAAEKWRGKSEIHDDLTIMSLNYKGNN